MANRVDTFYHHFKNILFWKLLFTLKKNIYFAIYEHHYSSIETWWLRWIEQKTVSEVNIIHSSACKICTEGITDVPKHNNSCYDHIFMIRSKISPPTSLLSADSTAAWALHECGAGIAAQCELVQLPANVHIPEAIRQWFPLGRSPRRSSPTAQSNELLIPNSDSDPRSCSQHPRHIIPPINLVSTLSIICSWRSSWSRSVLD